MRNIYDAFNNVQPIEMDADIMDEQEAHALVKRLGIGKKKSSRMRLAAACIAGAIVLTGGTAYAYSQGVFEDWVIDRNNGNVSEEYIDHELLEQNYNGVVDVKSVDVSTDLTFDILRMNVTDKNVYIAMIVTYSYFDADACFDFSVDLSCNGNVIGSNDCSSNIEYPNLQLNDNQRLICKIFDFEDTSLIKASGKAEITVSNLQVYRLVEGYDLEGQPYSHHSFETVDYGHWDLTIPVTEYSELKYAIIPEDSKVCEIYVYNWGLHMTKKYWMDWGDYQHNAVKIITDDGELLENLDAGSQAYIDHKYSYHSWHFNVPINIDKIKYVEVKGERFEIKQ